MRKALAVLGIALMIGGPAAAAGNGSPMDDMANHPALYGLCTAYFSGQGGEHGKKNSAPPFAALEDAADAAETGNQDGETSEQEMIDFCQGVRPSNGQGGGSGNSNAPSPTAEKGKKQG